MNTVEWLKPPCDVVSMSFTLISNIYNDTIRKMQRNEITFNRKEVSSIITDWSRTKTKSRYSQNQEPQAKYVGKVRDKTGKRM